MKNTLLGSLYLSLTASIWGGMYVVMKVVVDIVPLLELVWLRYVIALFALLLIGTITKRDWLLIILIGFIGNTISIVTQEVGTMLSTAQMGAILTSTTPAFMVLLTVGVYVIVGTAQIDTSSQLGGLSLIIAAFTWSLMSVLALEFDKNRKLTLMLFCVALLQVVVFIDSIVVCASK